MEKALLKFCGFVAAGGAATWIWTQYDKQSYLSWGWMVLAVLLFTAYMATPSGHQGD